jgi:hypothetical protein
MKSLAVKFRWWLRMHADDWEKRKLNDYAIRHRASPGFALELVAMMGDVFEDVLKTLGRSRSAARQNVSRSSSLWRCGLSDGACSCRECGNRWSGRHRLARRCAGASDGLRARERRTGDQGEHRAEVTDERDQAHAQRRRHACSGRSSESS